MHEPSIANAALTTAPSVSPASIAIAPYTREELEMCHARVSNLEFGGAAGFHACRAHLSMDTIEAISYVQNVFGGSRHHRSAHTQLCACKTVHEAYATLQSLLAEDERDATPEIMRYALIALLRARAGVFDRRAPEETALLLIVDQALIDAGLLR